MPIELPELIGKVSAAEVFDKETGEVLLECNEEVTEITLYRLSEARDAHRLSESRHFRGKLVFQVR